MNKTDDFTIHIKGNIPNKNKYISAFFSLTIFLFLIYSNSFECTWHYDDYGNIVANASIQITELSWHNVEKSLYGIEGSNRWQRPVSYFSFALNYYLGGLDTFGYHFVNLSIHCLTAFFLFLFIYHTLNLPLIRTEYEETAYSIALLAALLWAINPIQVSAVTYIVQRMASMVALFYIMAMFFYLKGRTGDRRWKKLFFYGLTIVCGALAFGTKENAAMLPVSLFFYDVLLIRGIADKNIKRILKYGIIVAISVLAIGLLYIEDIANFSADYQKRPFTMVERVLTQPRIIILYISLLLYPITSRLMLIHDVDLSTSLLSPWPTLPAIILVILIVIAALRWSRKWPLISYCVLFFFINHLIEGSFIPLELIYEHRNYLPSMLFFLPISMLLIQGLRLYVDRKGLRLLIIMAVIFVIIVQGMTVYIQNNIYQDDISLWSDNKEKSPRLHTVRQNLATAYFIAGRLPEAFIEGQEALKSYQAAMPSKMSRTHGLLGEYYFKNNLYDQALTHYKESLKLDPSYHVINRRMSEIMLSKNKLQEAEHWIKRGLSVKPDSFTYHAILARILLNAGSPDRAISEAFKSLRLNPDQVEPYVILSDAFRAKMDDDRANHFRHVAESLTKKGSGSYGAPTFFQAAP